MPSVLVSNRDLDSLSSPRVAKHTPRVRRGVGLGVFLGFAPLGHHIGLLVEAFGSSEINY